MSKDKYQDKKAYKPDKKRSSSTAGSNRGRAAKIVVYCPHCPIVITDPELTPRITVSPRDKEATCSKGHTFPVGGHSVPMTSSR